MKTLPRVLSLAGLLFFSLPSALPAAEPSAAPKQLTASIGGFPGKFDALKKVLGDREFK